MPSKVLEEYLKKATPAEKSALVEHGLKLDRNGVEPASQAPPAAPTAPVGERADVKQINQEWQQGKNVRIETVAGKSDLALADGQNPRTGPGKSGPYDPPKFMDEARNGQIPTSQDRTPGSGPAAQPAAPNEKSAPSGPTASPPIGNAEPAGKPRNAYQEALIAGEKAKPSPGQEKQATKEVER